MALRVSAENPRLSLAVTYWRNFTPRSECRKGHPRVACPGLSGQRKSPLFFQRKRGNFSLSSCLKSRQLSRAQWRVSKSVDRDEGSGSARHEMWPVKVRPMWPQRVLKGLWVATQERHCLQDQQDQHNQMGGNQQHWGLTAGEEGAQLAQTLKIFKSMSQHGW